MTVSTSGKAGLVVTDDRRTGRGRTVPKTVFTVETRGRTTVANEVQSDLTRPSKRRVGWGQKEAHLSILDNETIIDTGLKHL